MRNKKVFLPEYDEVEELQDNLDYPNASSEKFYLLTKYKKKGLAAENGNRVLANQYESIQVLPQMSWNKEERYFIVAKNGNQGVVMSDDRECIPIVYDEIEDVYDLYDGGVFDQHFFLVTKNNKKGVLNTKNEVEIPIVYENLINAGFDGDPYCNEDNLYYVIEENRKQGMIDRKNNVLIPAVYDQIGENSDFEMIPISNCLYVKVIKDGQFGLYNIHKEMVLPAVYDSIEALKIKRHRNCEPAFFVSKKHKTGIVDINNQVILPIIYDKIGYLPIEIGYKTGHYFFVAKDQKKGFLDIHGEPIIPIVYDRLKVIGSEDGDLVKFLALKDGEKQEITIKMTQSDWQK